MKREKIRIKTNPREYLMTTLCNELSKLNRDSKTKTTKVRTVRGTFCCVARARVAQ